SPGRPAGGVRPAALLAAAAGCLDHPPVRRLPPWPGSPAGAVPPPARGRSMSLLLADGLVRSFGGVTAVDGVTFALEAGEIAALIGPNGAGKSTCFNILMGQLRPDRGRVEILGREVTGWPARRIWRLGVGRTFQVAQTFGSFTVRENLELVLAS